MGQSYFIWNNIDCRSRGIIQASAVPIVRPEERVQHVTIPGVSGDLTETEGENIYNSYIQTVSISVRGAYNVRDIYKWLRGSGYVTFSGEPDKRQKARVIGAITLNKLSKNMDVWQGEVQFYCQPLKELLKEGTVTVTSSGATVRNNGDVSCKPVYKVTVASGQTAISLTVGGATLTVTDLTAGGVYWIDCAAMEVWNSDRTALMTRYSAGDFPELAPGDNTITFTGCSSIEIEKRERYL